MVWGLRLRDFRGGGGGGGGGVEGLGFRVEGLGSDL